MTFEAIKPSGFVMPEKSVIAAELDRLGRKVASDTKQYPPWRPWKNPPKTGKRAGGRRTGDLGRSVDYKVSGYVLRVESTGVRYAKYVIGRDQTRVMAARAWKTIRAHFERNYPDTQRRLQLWARLRVK